MFWPFLLLLALFFTCMLLNRLFRYPVEDFDDLIDLARAVDDLEMENLLDVRKEAELKASLSPAEFRTEQRKRITKAFEYLRRWSFNGLAMLHLAHAQWRRYARPGADPSAQEKLALIQETIQAGVEFRIYCMGAVFKAGLWVLLRADKWPLVMPSVPDLRHIGKIDGIHAYYRLTSAIGYLSLSHGEECYDSLMVKLRGRVPNL